MKIVFATHNQNKFNEVKALVPNNFELVSLKDINCNEEIAETANTIEGNAQIKADFISENYGLDCFADDTGLLVDALNGAPGVYSARYAGEQKSAEDNMSKLLRELKNQNDRGAHFKTVIALNLNTTKSMFEGIVKGQIVSQKKGGAGFGYDPIFKPHGYNQTFAELSVATKNKISHRGLAIQKLIIHLNQLS